MDSNGKITNEELVKAMALMKENDNLDTKRNYLMNVVKAKFLIPAKMEKRPDKDENGEPLKKGKVRVNFCVITNPEKKSFLPVFTDEEEMAKGKYEDAEKVVIQYQDLEHMVLASKGELSGIVINPHGEGFIIPVELIADLEKNKKKTNIKKNEIPTNANIKLRTPKYMPVDMLEAASKLMTERQEVKCAYLQMMEKDNGDDEYLIAVDLDGDELALFNDLMPVMRPHSFGINIALTNVKNGLGAKVAEIAEPFYVKES